jgi:hypothetical protein
MTFMGNSNDNNHLRMTWRHLGHPHPLGARGPGASLAGSCYGEAIGAPAARGGPLCNVRGGKNIIGKNAARVKK